MKRLLLTIALTLMALVTSAQSMSFWGLQFGESYTKEQILAAVGDDAEFFVPEDEEQNESPIQFVRYHFANPEYEGRTYDLMNIVVLSDTNQLVYIEFLFLGGDDEDEERLNRIYASMSDSLNRLYPLVPAATDDPSITRFSYSDVSNNYYTVWFDKITKEGAIVMIDLVFLSPVDISAADCKDIQDTFFGMKMKCMYSVPQIKDVLRNNGSFLEEEKKAGQISVTFTEVYFAGHTWDYCEISLSKNGEFYSIDFYDSYRDYVTDEMREKKNEYNSLKSRLDNKYGERESDRKGQDDITTVYYGRNKMVIILKDSKEKSKGGSYRWYLHLTYIQSEIMSAQTRSFDDEL